MPDIEVNRHGALTDTELVHGDRRVIHELDPAGDAACGALETPDVASAGTDLAEIKPHAAAELAHLSEVIKAPVDAGEAVRHGVNEAGRQLVIRLTGVRESRRRHRHFEFRQHVVEPLHVLHPDVFLFRHREVKRHAEEQFLRALEDLVIVALDHVALEHELKAGVVEELIPVLIDQAGGLINLFLRVVLENVLPVEAVLREEHELRVEVRETEVLLTLRELPLEAVAEEPPGDLLVAGRVLRRELHGGTDQGVELLVDTRGGRHLGIELRGEDFKRILRRLEVILDLEEAAIEVAVTRRDRKREAAGTEFRPLFAVQNEVLRDLVVAALHQSFFDTVLNGFYGAARCHENLLFHEIKQLVEIVGLFNACALKRFRNSKGNFFAIVLFGLTASFSYQH